MILRDRVRPVTRLAIVAALLFLQFSIDFSNRVSELFPPVRVVTLAFQIDEPLSDSARSDLGEIEMQLLVFQQLHVALNHASPGFDVRPADTAGSLACPLPDVSLGCPPPGAPWIEGRARGAKQLTRLALP